VNRLILCAVLLTACDDDDVLATRAEMLDPQACAECHPNHYDEWKSSMHAYAAEDPVFRAMNQRAQDEADLGGFCVNCHAPMAVIEGATVDGTNLDEVPEPLQGITCYFCHQVIDVPGPFHNNPLVLANDNIMRGGLGALGPPVDNGFHGMQYSQLHDRRSRRSADLCGACHDIVLPNEVELERTFSEWNTTVFASDNPIQRLTCGQCHMKGDIPGTVADFEDVPLRFPHEHTWPGIDVAITDWPGKQMQLEQISRELDPSLNPKLCVTPNDGGTIEYKLDNVGGGHFFPTGAAQDRRAWAEVVAYDSADAVIFETGVVGDTQPVAEAAKTDTDLWQMRDFVFGAGGEDVHMFWEVETIDSDELLAPVVTLDVTDPRFNHSTSKFFLLQGAAADRVTAVVYIRPIGLEILDELIDSGHLDPSLRDASVTHTIEGTRLEWTMAEVGFGCVCALGPC